MINIHTIESPKNALHFLYMILLQCSVNADKNKNKMRKSQYCVSRKKHRGRLAMPNIRVTKSNCQVSRSKATNKITKKKNQNKNENEKKKKIYLNTQHKHFKPATFLHSALSRSQTFQFHWRWFLFLAIALSLLLTFPFDCYQQCHHPKIEL